MIALGHKGTLQRLLEPPTLIKHYFVNIEPYQGKGSGLGYNNYLANSICNNLFFFVPDTLLDGTIHEPTYNWMGYAESDDLLQYRTLYITGGNVTQIREKRV